MQTSFMESDRLSFRVPEHFDVEILAGWVNDPRIRRFLDHRVFPVARVAEEAWVRGLAEQGARGARTDVVFLFGKKGEEKPMGCCGLHAINWIARSAEFGILIGDVDEQQRGFGREVSRRMLAYAFSDLNLNRVYLRVNATHAVGIKCYENAGFIREGVTRQSFFREGRYEDTVIMGALAGEWVRPLDESDPKR